MELKVNNEMFFKWIGGMNTRTKLEIINRILNDISSFELSEYGYTSKFDCLMNLSQGDVSQGDVSKEGLCDDCLYDQEGKCKGGELPCDCSSKEVAFEVGDKVRIKSEDQLRKLNNSNVKGDFHGVVGEMYEMAGKVKTVEKVVERDGHGTTYVYYRLVDTDYNWNTEMLELVERKPEVESDGKLKVGDKVRIKSRDELKALNAEKVKGRYKGIVKPMLEMAGEVVTISKVKDDNEYGVDYTYYGVEGSEFHWNIEMLDPIDKPADKPIDETVNVGDFVRIKPIEELKLVNGLNVKGKFYGLPSKMLAEAGRIMYVSDIIDNYYLLDDQTYRWNRETFDPVDLNDEEVFIDLLKELISKLIDDED